METRKNFYLIFKEAVNNAVKYSLCSELIVNISQSNDTIIMSIEDNGTGFDLKNHHEGNGIQNMKSRAKELHGDLIINSMQQSGTKVRLLFNIP